MSRCYFLTCFVLRVLNVSHVHMDGRAMEFADETFDVVIDKGALDAILCLDGPTWNAGKYLLEVSRVLRLDGVYIVVSHGKPVHRYMYLRLEVYGWEVQTFTVQKPMMGMTTSISTDDCENVHYIYVCKKGGVSSGGSAREVKRRRTS